MTPHLKSALTHRRPLDRRVRTEGFLDDFRSRFDARRLIRVSHKPALLEEFLGFFFAPRFGRTKKGWTCLVNRWIYLGMRTQCHTPSKPQNADRLNPGAEITSTSTDASIRRNDLDGGSKSSFRHQLYIPKPAELNDPKEARPKIAAASVGRFIKMLMRLRPPMSASRGATPSQSARIQFAEIWRR